MAEKKKGISGVFVFVIVGVALMRIIMVMGRTPPNKTHQNWDNTLLMWSIFVIIAVIGSYFYYQNKEDRED